jgi:hypothetical protein
MVCLIGSGLLGGGPELGIPDTSTKFILGRSNSAVRAMEEAGVNSLQFLETVRRKPSNNPIKPHPSFYVFWKQPDRTRILRVEEVGEFEHQQAGGNIHYPATLGLLDSSTARNLQALIELEALVNDIRTPEHEFQGFFERHPEFLMSDEHVDVRPGILLSGSPDFGLKPDFFLQRRDTPLWDLAELKLPSAKLVRGIPQRRGLTAAVQSAMDQLRTYKDFFLDNKLAEDFRKQHGLEIYHPRLTLIIGRDASFGSYHERQRLSPPEVRLLTYDDLVRIAKHRALVLPFVEKKLPPKR